MSLNFHTSENFDTLRTEIINPCDFEDLPDKVKKALNHGGKLEPRLRELYIDVMKLKLRHFGNWLGNKTIPVLVSCFSRWTCCIPNQ